MRYFWFFNIIGVIFIFLIFNDVSSNDCISRLNGIDVDQSLIKKMNGDCYINLDEKVYIDIDSYIKSR